MLKLNYSALSPFARKVRMVLDYKRLEYEILDMCEIEQQQLWNPRAEIPVLGDADVVVANSADIVAYLDRKFADRPVLPADPASFAIVRRWELTADTIVDAIVTDVGIWQWAELPPMPDGFMEASRAGIASIYSDLEHQLEGGDFVAGSDVTVADYALYPQLGAAQVVGLPVDAERHPRIRAWLRRMRHTEEGQRDLAEVRAWWADRANSTVDTKRINWGTHRLEWFLANGHVEWFAEQVRQDKVLWSVGPRSNARRSPLWRDAA